MSDRAINCVSQEVLGLRDGLITMTRRVLKPQPEFVTDRGRRVYPDGAWRKTWRHGTDDDLPYAVGQRLWVREAWQTGSTSNGPQIAYRATPDFCPIQHAWDGPDEGIGPSFNYDKCPGAQFCHWLGDVLDKDGPWRSSSHMPRWASRLTLIVENVKVERLQEISEADAIAQGCGLSADQVALNDELRQRPKPVHGDAWLLRTARGNFIETWCAIHGGIDAWDANPWVCAIGFRVIKANIDSEEAPRADRSIAIERLGSAQSESAIASAASG